MATTEISEKNDIIYRHPVEKPEPVFSTITSNAPQRSSEKKLHFVPRSDIITDDYSQESITGYDATLMAARVTLVSSRS